MCLPSYSMLMIRNKRQKGAKKEGDGCRACFKGMSFQGQSIASKIIDFNQENCWVYTVYPKPQELKSYGILDQEFKANLNYTVRQMPYRIVEVMPQHSQKKKIFSEVTIS